MSSSGSAGPEIISPAAVGAGMSQIIAARAYDVDVDDLCRPGRGEARVALARQVAIYLAHVVFAMNFGVLARAFGRTRATTRYAVQRVEALRDDPNTDQTLAWLETVLRAAAGATR